MASEVSLALGEYLTLWVILGVIAIGALGYFMGTALGGAVLFVVVGIAVVLVIYAILARLFRFLLHGSISADGGDS